jgi:DNA repair exonuclease SbcCD ATPase subunit
MYENHILNKLTDRTNKIIKSLCHINTKPFKLDYLITIIKAIIHINWLINNEIETNSKQLISINQASGFQRFVISLALRMSLFVNKQEIMCNQLFIDEGFINFDKENLSIVPSFIKGLLSYFNNIVIVSHIDLIQDNIDEIAEIKYNKINSVSTMEYGNYKKVIKKRNKHQKD